MINIMIVYMNYSCKWSHYRKRSINIGDSYILVQGPAQAGIFSIPRHFGALCGLSLVGRTDPVRSVMVACLLACLLYMYHFF